MPEKDPSRQSRTTGNAPTTPEGYPTSPTPGLSAIDHSFTLQTMMEVQRAVGALTQAISTLTEQSKEQGKKIDDVRMDMHAAKAAGKTLLWIVWIVGTLLGIFLSAYFRQVIGNGNSG